MELYIYLLYFSEILDQFRIPVCLNDQIDPLMETRVLCEKLGTQKMKAKELKTSAAILKQLHA